MSTVGGPNQRNVGRTPEDNPDNIKTTGDSNLKPVDKEISEIAFHIPHDQSQGLSGTSLASHAVKQPHELHTYHREKITNLLLSQLKLNKLSQDRKILPGDRMTPEEYAEIKENLKKDPAKLGELKAYIDMHEEEISGGGMLRSLEHTVAKWFGISIAGQAQKLYQEAYDELVMKQTEVEDSRDDIYLQRSTLSLGNGVSYEGTVKNGTPHGYGKITFTDEAYLLLDFFNKSNTEKIDVYIGEIDMGDPKGIGKFIMKDGAVYTGEFARGDAIGTFTGKGTKTHHGVVDTGTIVDGKLEGLGTRQEKTDQKPVQGRFDKGVFTPNPSKEIK